MRTDDTATDVLSAEGLRIGVVTALFNGSITEGLKEGALEYLSEAQADEVFVVDAPGAFELPLIAAALTRAGVDAVVCLGAVIEGDTDHYAHVAHRASEGLMRVQIDTGIPIAFGILTVRDLQDAEIRSAAGPDNKGREAAHAAVMTALTLKAIG
ncbi:MAG: 6,7-dimethyl-8-ribityllumazine synthase [Actinomycetia bacterium]|nr:6,7-dimethyl-8-ribityllumazine synthase [Actinomycetes bacterium]